MLKNIFEFILALPKLFFFILLIAFITLNMEANELSKGKQNEKLANLIDFFESQILLFTLILAVIEVASIIYTFTLKNRAELELVRRVSRLESKLLEYEKDIKHLESGDMKNNT
ncbi:hypothetical protein [Lysinibacillus pakistanensis]|uniref:DUF1049 domain-containing protein n=1 Tax=Lysinibacillus pakistanensis TaxID=759811 RepID=A0ABX6DEL1_9BACI|nr:hypothetical protein GDS87_10970 [Lysinibacillus pakistanensis]